MLEMFPENQVSITFYFGHCPLDILFQIFCVDSMFVYTQKRNIERMQMKTQKNKLSSYLLLSMIFSWQKSFHFLYDDVMRNMFLSFVVVSLNFLQDATQL